MRPLRLALSLLLLLAAPALAAAPSAIDRLPSLVVGVTGSGDDLRLQIIDGEARRSLKVGDLYADGWTLQAIDPTQATLTRDAERRTVGLNPTGALAQARSNDPPSTVTTALAAARVADLNAQIARIRANVPILTQLLADQLGPWDGKTPHMGLSLAETQRYAAYRARQPATGPNGFLGSDQVNALGTDAADYLALNQKLLDALQDQRGFRDTILTLTPKPKEGAAPRPPAQPETMLGTSQFLTESNLFANSFPKPDWWPDPNGP